MKAPLFYLALLLALFYFLAGCHKDLSPYTPADALPAKAARSHPSRALPLKANMDVYHVYTPDVANGGCYCAPYLPGYMGGEGEGRSTLLGKFYTYSNLYAYYNAAGIEITYTVPLTPDYYQQLTPYFAPAVAQAIRERQVKVIFFDRQGNSLWSEIDTLHMVPAPTNPLHFTLSGRGAIVSGTGKFAGATGYYTFSGYSDVFRDSAPGVPYQHSWFDMEGAISY